MMLRLHLVTGLVLFDAALPLAEVIVLQVLLLDGTHAVESRGGLLVLRANFTRHDRTIVDLLDFKRFHFALVRLLSIVLL